MKPHPAADPSGSDDLEVDSEEDKRDLEELMAEAEQHSQNASLMAYSGEGSLTGAPSHHQVWSPTVNFALFTFLDLPVGQISNPLSEKHNL